MKGDIDPGDAPENKELRNVERLLKDAEHEGQIARHALEKEAEDLAEANCELDALEHPRLVTIIVDGTPHELPKKERVTYAEVVTLAYPDYPQHPETTYSVTYSKGPRENPEGILSPGGSVKIKEGMAFRVNRTGQS